MKRSLRVIAVALVILVAAASAGAQKAGPPPGSEASSSCFKATSSGSGPTFFRHCVSNHGNITEITSPSGSGNHIFSEGYAICQEGGEVYADNFFVESDFLAPSTASAGSNVRTTVDGAIKLTQTFSRDNLERELIITMTIKNNRTFSLPGVTVSRWVDADIGISSADSSWGRTATAVFGYDADGQGLELRAGTPGFGTSIQVSPAGGLGTGCSSPQIVSVPTGAGDFAGRVSYFLGTIPAGGTKVVKFVYRVF